tara:strand:+ start:405 stop:1046 length:642 start_codon:yes stop_codon:yes gene_type:complete
MAPVTRSGIKKNNKTIPGPKPYKTSTQTTLLGTSTENPHRSNRTLLIELLLNFLFLHCPATFKTTTAEDLVEHFKDDTVKSLEYKQNDKTVYIIGQITQTPTRSKTNNILDMQYLLRPGADVGPKAKKTPRSGPKPSYPAILKFLKIFKQDKNYSFSNESWVSVSLDNDLEGENLKKLQDFYEKMGFKFDGKGGFATVETIEQNIKLLMRGGE